MRTTVQKKIKKKFDNFQFEEIDMGRIVSYSFNLRSTKIIYCKCFSGPE